jgi:Tol biopolymer transport system component
MKANHYSVTVLLGALFFIPLFLASCTSPNPQAPGSPSGSKSDVIVFSAWQATSSIPNYEIYSMNVDGTGRVNLTNNEANDTYPAYSPDGKQIAFCSNRNGQSELFLMNEDGSNQHLLTNQVSDCGDPSWSVPVWSPDGKWIGITSTTGGTNPNGKMDIFIVRSDASHMYNLTNDPAYDSGLSWSPDSKQIAFASDRNGNFELYVVDIDGKNLTQLTNDSAVDGQPVWSPDGKTLIFKSQRTGYQELYSMNADGSNLTQLTRDMSINTNPVWSPDGENIYYSSNKDGNIEIYRMKATGVDPVNLTNSLVDDYWFWLSPDGSQIIFSSCLSGCELGSGTWNTSIMNSDGTNVRELLKLDASVSWKP